MRPAYGAYGTGGAAPAPAAGIPPYVPPYNPPAHQQQPLPPPPAYQDAGRYPLLPPAGAGGAPLVGGGAGMPAGMGTGAAIGHAPARAIPAIPTREAVDATKIAECMQEMKLKDHKERERLDSLSELYSIIRTMDRLEKAFIADQLNTHEYETTCSKLIAQFKASLELVGMTMVDMPKFTAEHELSCKAAMSRFQIAVPATVEHGLQSKKPGQHPKDVAECVQHFITAMDSLRLNMVAVDQLQPLISELVTALNKITALPPDFEAKEKMKEWLKTFAKMRATDELDENQARQLLFELESSHNMFYQSL